MILNPFWVLELRTAKSAEIPRIIYICPYSDVSQILHIILREVHRQHSPLPRVCGPRFWGIKIQKPCFKAGALVLMPSESTTLEDYPPSRTPSHLLQLARFQHKIACQLNWHHEPLSSCFLGIGEIAKFL